MSVKKEVLKLLEGNRDIDLSGQDIAERLGVTRAAVWKAVKSLKEEGYHVEAKNNRGYRLCEDTDVLSAEGIRPGIRPEYRDREIIVYKTIDSTNMEVKRRALEGADEGLLVVAEEQTSGRGRRGRDFYSPAGTGIYMSILFRPAPEKSKDVVRITTAASVAICRAIMDVLGQEPQIKWVNDVYLRDKKVCGILTEAVSDFESGRIDTVIVGIGINYHTPKGGFPNELGGIAGSLCDEDTNIPRNALVAAVADGLYDLYDHLEQRTYMKDYRRLSYVIGKEVRYTSGDDWAYGKAIDIDEDGGLIVSSDDGQTHVLHTGEITLRVMEKE